MARTPLDPEPLKAVQRRYRSHTKALDRAKQTRAELQSAIRAARAEGHSLQSIGDRMGVTAQRVDAILKATTKTD
jgi:DNA-binding MarR family transcriptional regulator